jgi:hypothetical protein
VAGHLPGGFTGRCALIITERTDAEGKGMKIVKGMEGLKITRRWVWFISISPVAWRRGQDLDYSYRDFFFFFLMVLGLEPQGLHLEPLHQPFLVIFKFFSQIGSREIICLGWLQTAILLISVS